VLESVETGGTRRRAAAVVRTRGVPGLSPAAAAVAWTQARAGLRSVRGRLAVLMPGPLVAGMSLLSVRAPGEFPGGAALGSHGHITIAAGLVFALYTLLGFTMNQFGSDRAGLTLQLLAPARDVDLITGKAAGGAMLFGVAAALCVLSTLVVGGMEPSLAWVTVLVAGAATYMLLAPLAALSSILLPVPSDMSKTGAGGNPHGLAMLGGTLAILSAAAVPATIVSVYHHDRNQPELALLLIAGWSAVAAVAGVFLLRAVARLLGPRRENLALIAERR
jgi:hypothetical protein